MPTLPLMTDATHPDGWRQVRAPGGYESWSFTAHTPRGRTCILAGLHLGHPLDPAYAQRYRVFEKFPTRTLPPVPADYPSVSLTVVQDDQLIWRMLHPQRGAEFIAMTHTGEVRIGSSHVETALDGSIRLRMRGGEGGRIATVDLVFKPRPAAACDELVEGPHRVAIVAPVCDVDGQVELFDPGQPHPTLIEFAGAGAHEHRFGLRMLDEPFLSGALVEDGKCVLLHGWGSRIRAMEVGSSACLPLTVSPSSAREFDASCAMYEIERAGERRGVVCETIKPVSALGLLRQRLRR